MVETYVADTLFNQTSKCKDNVSCNDNIVNNAELFDDDCHYLNIQYKDALKLFKIEVNNESRRHLCQCKKEYKSIMSKKKRSFELSKLNEIENLRTCNMQTKEF